jgi:hypothetical protein
MMDSIFDVKVIVDDVDSLMTANVEIIYNSSILQVRDVSKGDFLMQNGGYVVLFDTTRYDTTADNDTLLIETGVGGWADPEYVDGTGVIATITFQSIGLGKFGLTFTDQCTLLTSRQSGKQILFTDSTTVHVYQ